MKRTAQCNVILRRMKFFKFVVDVVTQRGINRAVLKCTVR